MAQKKSKPRERQIGKKKPVKKPLINPRYKNTFWTIIVFLILLIFFIINNTRPVPEHGPFPPSYNPATAPKPDTAVDKRLQMNTKVKDNNK